MGCNSYGYQPVRSLLLCVRHQSQHIEILKLTFINCFPHNIYRYVGTGVVSLPASVALGGWVSLVLVTIVGILACATGLQIADGFEKTNSQTYYEFAYAAGGTVTETCTLVILTFFFVSSNVFNSLIIMDTMHSTFLYFDLVDEGTIYAISISLMTVLVLILIAFDILLPRGLTMIGELLLHIIPLFCGNIILDKLMS